MNFIIGSTNDAKIKAAKEVIGSYFPQAKIDSAVVNSGVPDQPYGDDDTRLGALNRAFKASCIAEGVIGIGLEGGVREFDEKLYICNWGALILPTGERFTAGGAQIPLPEDIANEIRRGEELGPMVEKYYGLKDLRYKEGAIGLLTNGAINRSELFAHILQLLIGQWQYSLKMK